jgi:hypothetical protein
VTTFHLRAQTSKTRQRRIESAAENALRRAGAPYRRWAVFVVDSPSKTEARLYRREVFLEELRNKAAADPAKASMLLDVDVRCQRHWGKVPELIAYAEGGVDLNFITCPEGTW